MEWRVISKQGTLREVPANLTDYASVVKAFCWKAASHELDGLPDGGLNIAFEAVDRHVRGPFRNRIALRFLAQEGDVHEYTYNQLHLLTNRFANVLSGFGIGSGDRVATLLGRVPDLFIAALGTFKNKAVFLPAVCGIRPRTDSSAS